MWWIIGVIVACGVALLTGAFIREGNPWGDHEDGPIIDDRDPNEGDRS
jgi:hypothetical protein